MTSIEISPRTLNDKIEAIEVDGEIDIHTAPRVDEAVNRAIDADCRRLILDLDRVSYIDSSGLVVLINTFKRMQVKNGKVVFVCSNPHILKVLELTGLSQVMTIFKTQDAATASFEPGA
jgi:anti-sigma B factor antagonist